MEVLVSPRTIKVAGYRVFNKSLLDLEIRPIRTEEEREKLLQRSMESSGVFPIFPTHIVYKKGEIVGSFSISSPTVYWWMDPNAIKIRDSMSIFQACDALMTEQGYSTYILPCEAESPYYKGLSNKLDHLKSKHNDDWRLFLNKSGE